MLKDIKSRINKMCVLFEISIRSIRWKCAWVCVCVCMCVCMWKYLWVYDKISHWQHSRDVAEEKELETHSTRIKKEVTRKEKVLEGLHWESSVHCEMHFFHSKSQSCSLFRSDGARTSIFSFSSQFITIALCFVSFFHTCGYALHIYTLCTLLCFCRLSSDKSCNN